MKINKIEQKNPTVCSYTSNELCMTYKMHSAVPTVSAKDEEETRYILGDYFLFRRENAINFKISISYFMILITVSMKTEESHQDVEYNV